MKITPLWLKHLGTWLFVLAERHRFISWLVPVLVFGWTFSYFYYAAPFLKYMNLPFPVSESVLHEGEQIHVNVRRCNISYGTETYLISRTLENVATQQQYALSDSIVQIEPGCHDDVNVSAVPAGIVPGTYRMLGISQVQTEFRIHYVSWQSQPFTIVPK